MDGNILTNAQHKEVLGQYVKIDGVETTFYKVVDNYIITEHADWTGYDVSAVYIKQPVLVYEQNLVITSIVDQKAFLTDSNGVALTDSQYASLYNKQVVLYTGSIVGWCFRFTAGDSTNGIGVTTLGTLGTQDFLNRSDIQALLPAVPIHTAV